MAATIESVLAAIKQHESGGDYTIITRGNASASGAYQMIDSTWRSALQMAGLGHLAAQYPRAYLAPPNVQDQAAMALAQDALRRGGGDLRAIPAIWYIGHVPSASEWDEVPSPEAGNTITVRSFVDYVMSRAGDPNYTGDIAASGGQFTSMEEDPSNYTDDELIAYVQQNYGSMSWALGIPEVRDILFSGIRDGWSEARIQAAVQASNYYKKSSDRQRQWTVLYATNPGEAAQQLQLTIGDLNRMARTLGVSITRDRLQMVAWNAVSMGWDGEEMQRALLGEANWNGRHIGEFGTIGATVTQVNQLAEAYGLTLNRDRALGITRDILSGAATMESITAGFKTQAKALFPAFAQELDAGMRLADIAQPYMQTAAQLLEISPAEMRLTDPLWSSPLTRRQNGKPSPMSLDEWTTHVMTDKKYGWDRTNNAMTAAASFVEDLGGVFGVF